MSTTIITSTPPAPPPMTNSPQLEASLEATVNPTQHFGSRIREITYDAPAFEDVEEFRAAFEKAEKGAHEAAKKKFNAEAELILYLAMIQSFLSERGTNAHLRKAAGIKAGFEEWYLTFRAKYDVDFAFKTVQHKIAQLRGGCDHCGRLVRHAADHKKSCVMFRPLIDIAEQTALAEQTGEDADKNEKGGSVRSGKLDMRATRNAFYADRYLSMVGLLTNAPPDATPPQIIATMQQEAITAHQDLDAQTARQIRVPRLVKVVERTWEDREIRRIAVKISSQIVECQSGLKGLSVGGSQTGKVIINNAKTILEYDSRASVGLATADQSKEAGQSTDRLKATVQELKAEVLKVRGQMSKLVEKACEIRDPAKFLEWINDHA
jgi:hypothetical protein